MLQKKAVRSNTLELIRSLQSDEFFNDFYLVGGTALALQIGHRESIDIDLFTTKDFDVNSTLEYLEQEYAFSLQLSAKNTLIKNRIILSKNKYFSDKGIPKM